MNGKLKRAVAKLDAAPKPDKVETSSVFAALVSGGLPSKVLDTRWGNEIIPIRFLVLPMRDIQQAKVDASKHFRELKVDPTEETYQSQLIAHLLEVACVETELTKVSNGKTFYRRIFQSVDEVLSLTDDQVIMLFEQYLLVKTEFAIPDDGAIRTREDLDVWIQAMQREADASFLAQLPSHRLARLMHMMALEIQLLRSSLPSDWRDISELKAAISGLSTTSSIEPVSELSETPPSEDAGLHLRASRNELPSQDDESDEAKRARTSDLLAQLNKH